MRTTDIVGLARQQTRTNTTTFPDTQMLLYIKALLPQYQADIEGVDEDYQGSIEFRDLVATGTGYTTDDNGDTIYTREYNLPSDMIHRLKNVSAMLDGVNWTFLKNYELNSFKMPFEEDRILSKFSNEEGIAGYEIFRSSLFLLTGEIENDVSNGLKIWTYAFTACPASIPAVGSDDDVEFDLYGVPEVFHELFAMALSIKWKSSQEVPVPLSVEEQNYFALYNGKLGKLKGLDRSAEKIFQRPADPYDNGFNL